MWRVLQTTDGRVRDAKFGEMPGQGGGSAAVTVRRWWIFRGHAALVDFGRLEGLRKCIKLKKECEGCGLHVAG